MGELSNDSLYALTMAKKQRGLDLKEELMGKAE